MSLSRSYSSDEGYLEVVWSSFDRKQSILVSLRKKWTLGLSTIKWPLTNRTSTLMQCHGPQNHGTLAEGKGSTGDLLVKLACFVKKWSIHFLKKWTIFLVLKATDLRWLVQGGQRYWSFPFSEDSANKPKSLICMSNSCQHLLKHIRNQ